MREIWGFAVAWEAAAFAPNACLTEASNVSFADKYILSIASLNAAGEALANDKACVTASVCSLDLGTVVLEAGSRRREIVGRRIPSALPSIKSVMTVSGAMRTEAKV